MTTGKVGRQQRASTATTNTLATAAAEHDLNPYRNYSSRRGLNGSAEEDLVAEIATEDANNVVSNETVIIYQYGSTYSTTSRTQVGDHSEWERERIRTEFYATYDVMTGVRIAATLAGFFGLMVMLVMYKSRTNSLRSLKDPNLAAAAAEMVQEEEERELQEAFDTLEAAGIFPELETLPYRERRLLSLGNISAPPMLNYSPRFSSVGGGSLSLWDPPTRPGSSRYASMSVSSRPLPFSSATAVAANASSPGGCSRREAFRNSRNSSSDHSQCVSFDMSESTVRQMGRRRSNARAWMGRRATFQSIQADALLRSRNKVFLSNQQGGGGRQGRESNRIKLIRLYTTSSSREEDVEEVIEHGLLAEEETAGPEAAAAATQPSTVRQQSTSTTSFIVSSVDYQDSDLRSVGSESIFSEQHYADTDEEKERSSNSDDSDENGVEVARLKSGAYQKLKQKRATATARIDDCTVATYEADRSLLKVHSPPAQQRSSKSASRTTSQVTARPKSLHETRTFELHSLPVPKSQSTTSAFEQRRRELTATMVGQSSRDMVHQLLRREQEEEENEQRLRLGLPGTSTKWSKETLF